MAPNRKTRLTSRTILEKRRAWYEENKEKERERKKKSYQRKQKEMGKITKQSLMKENIELRRKQQITPNLPIIPQ